MRNWGKYQNGSFELRDCSTTKYGEELGNGKRLFGEFCDTRSFGGIIWEFKITFFVNIRLVGC
jgi:hypothetical protein